MFTGLIEETGVLESVRKGARSAVLRIRASKVTDGLKTGDKYVTNGITKLSDGMEIVPITPERYQQKIDEQAKAMTAGDIVGAMKK